MTHPNKHSNEFHMCKELQMQLSHTFVTLYICKSHFDHLMHKNTNDLLKGNVTACMKKVVRKPLFYLQHLSALAYFV